VTGQINKVFPPWQIGLSDVQTERHTTSTEKEAVMRNIVSVLVVVLVACCIAVLFVGCKKKEESVKKEESINKEVSVKKEDNLPNKQGISFSSSLPSSISGKSILPGGNANIEVLNGKLIKSTNKLSKGEKFHLEGWAIDTKTKTVPITVIIQLASLDGKDNYYAQGERIDKKRPDVAKLFNDNTYETSSIVLKTDVSPVPPGTYVVKVIQFTDNNPIVVDTGKKIELN
jgi:hypothetical protein